MVCAWRVRPNVGEVEIQRQKALDLGANDVRYVQIAAPGKPLLGNRAGLMTGRLEQFLRLQRQVLIDLEVHQAAPGEIGTIRSLASSAA